MKTANAKTMRQQYTSYRKERYREHPEAEKFVRRKTLCLKVLLAYLLFLTAFKALLLIPTGASLLIIFCSFVFGLVLNAIFLAAGMSANWRLAYVLYAWVFYNLFRSVSMLKAQGVSSVALFIETYRYGFQYNPFLVMSDILSLIYVLLVLAAAIWLTVPASSRQRAKEAEPLEIACRQYLQAQQMQK